MAKAVVMTIKKIKILDVRLDGGTQARASLSENVAAEYAESIREGVQMPPICVMFDGSNYWCWDGFHRYHAHVAAGQDAIDVFVTNGTCRMAVLWAIGANDDHGLRRSNEDKRRAVTMLLEDEEWRKWSQEQIADAAFVSTGLVSKMVAERASLHGEERPAVRSVERNGTTYEQDTSNIGKREAARFKGKPKKVAAAKWIDAEIKAASLEKEVASLREQVASAEIRIPASDATSEAEDIEDYGADLDLREELQAMHEEIAKLRKILEASDLGAEVLRYQDLYALAQRRSDEHLAAVNNREKQIKFLTRQLERCGKAIGELDQDKIAPAVEARIRALREAT